MKYIYLGIFALMSTSAVAQYGQIANGGFENWTNTPIYDSTVDWTCSNTIDYYGNATVLQSTDAQDGVRSLELVSHPLGSDTTFGYAYHGNEDVTIGIPYTDAFDEVQVYFKSNMPIGDSAYVMLQRFLLGVPQGIMFLPIANGNEGSWTLASVAIPAGAQDSLWIGLVLGDPFNDNLPTPGSWVRFDNIQLLNASTPSANLPDHSFENWNTFSFDLADDWYTTTELFIGDGLENALQTTDANSGAYALEMTTLLDPDTGDTARSFASFGPIDFFAVEPFIGASYLAVPVDFTGSYKYAPAGSDVAFIDMHFYAAGIEIGSHTEILSTQATYTSFTSALTISGTPDSLVFFVFSGNNPGSVLHVDDLAFSGGTVEVNEISNEDYLIYPNPASDILNIELKNSAINSYEILNIDGSVVTSGDLTNSSSSIDVSQLASGTYFIKLRNELTMGIQKIVIR